MVSGRALGRIARASFGRPFVSTSLIFTIAAVASLARLLNASVGDAAHGSSTRSCRLVFNLLMTSRMTGAQFGRMAAMSVLVTLTMGLVARLVAVPLRMSRPELSAFLLVVMFSNSGNYALPVVLFAFGNEALAFASVYFVVSAILVYTFGVFVAASGRASLRTALGRVL
jgi:hypothetical protein